jgi:serine/threonine protein kinase
MKLDLTSDLIFDAENAKDERGKGFTSKVIKGTLKSAALIEKHGSIPVAIKLMNSRDDDYLYEVAIMSCLPPTPYTVQLIGYSEKPKAIVMKYYPISLKLLLRSPEIGNNPMLRLKMGFDIANGMNVIHSHSILHLDLKPRTL